MASPPGEMGVMEHGANSLYEAAVQRLRDSVCGEASFSVLGLEK